MEKVPIARTDSVDMVGNEAEANKNASHFKTPTCSHSKSFGHRWELDPLSVQAWEKRAWSRERDGLGPREESRGMLSRSGIKPSAFHSVQIS